MRDQNERETVPTEDRSEPSRKPEQKKRKDNPADTLTDENPLICRGID